jgi:hypothetical protein
MGGAEPADRSGKRDLFAWGTLIAQYPLSAHPFGVGNDEPHQNIRRKHREVAPSLDGLSASLPRCSRMTTGVERHWPVVRPRTESRQTTDGRNRRAMRPPITRAAQGGRTYAVPVMASPSRWWQPSRAVRP